MGIAWCYVILGSLFRMHSMDVAKSQPIATSTTEIIKMLKNVEQDSNKLFGIKEEPIRKNRLELSELNYGDKVLPRHNAITQARENGKLYWRGEGKPESMKDTSFTYYPITPDVDETAGIKSHKKHSHKQKSLDIA